MAFTSIPHGNHNYAQDVKPGFAVSGNNGYMKGERIRELRTAKRMTQQQVADYCGVSRVAVAKWESGDTENLKPPHLFKLARLFGVSPEDIALGTGPMRPTDPRPPELPASVDALLAALKEQTSGLPPTARDMVADMIARFLATPPNEQEATAKAIAAFIASSKGKA